MRWVDRLHLRLVSWRIRQGIRAEGGLRFGIGWGAGAVTRSRAVPLATMRKIRYPLALLVMLAATFLLTACEDQLGQSPHEAFTGEPLQECSQEVFLKIAEHFASGIGVASSRDTVVAELKPFALAVHLAHAPDQRCQYEATVRLPVRRRPIDVVYPSDIGPEQTLSAKIVSGNEVCVNYRDHTNDVEAGELSDHSWSWVQGEGLLGKGLVRAFDPVCFAYD